MGSIVTGNKSDIETFILKGPHLVKSFVSSRILSPDRKSDMWFVFIELPRIIKALFVSGTEYFILKLSLISEGQLVFGSHWQCLEITHGPVLKNYFWKHFYGPYRMLEFQSRFAVCKQPANYTISSISK